ncbi:ATP-dependent sacrificial sulfur transferase LarE [archaeon]|nr:MAG: ATP-dependent sacrificial sulfur transferase LarE [archaeon]
METSQKKLSKLKDIVKNLGSAIVAFSGGVDSSFLAKVCYDVLGGKCFAVTAVSETYPQEDLKSAKRIAKLVGIKHVIIRTNEMKNKKFSSNPKDRCYYCKSELFSELRKLANKMKIKNIVDGTNADDLKDFRPGLKAKEEFGVASPLCLAGLEKSEIRMLSKDMRLPTHDKPSSPCLASRIPYNSEINLQKIISIEEAESAIRNLGYKTVRVRHHGDIARIEIGDKNIDLKKLKAVSKRIKKSGFKYVALDLDGYRTGSLNE